jgi:protein TonB
MPVSNVYETVALTYDDIIFQARHRAYGAFDLRRQYRPTLSRALGLGVGLFLLGLGAPMMYSRLWPNQALINESSMTEVTLTNVSEPPTEPPIPLPPVEQAPAVNTVRNLPPIVMPEADVVDENPPPTTDELQNATSGTQTAEGTGDVEVIAPPETTTPTVLEKVVEAEPKIEAPFITVEQQPDYPGGMTALRDFLSKNLTYPRAAASAGVSGKVFVSFVVNTDGSLTDIQVLKGIGFGCDEEAVRVMQKMPHWKPGKQSGRTVRVKFNLPISFTLE